MLTASHLTRRFGERVAVEDLSFDVAPGEIFALLGPNGAGKTTTLRLLAGLIEASSGGVQVNGEPMARASAARLRGRIGFLTEAPGLWDRLSVRQNLLVYARLQGVTDPSRAVDAALARFDMTARAGDVAAHLSKGMKQRVALARTLLHQPSIVLLDEPTSGLDPATAREVRELIVHMRSEGRAILLCTHNLDEVERIADTVAVVRTRLIALDTPGALRSRIFGSRLHVTIAGAAERYVDVLRAAGLTDVRSNGSTLSIGMSGEASTPAIVRQLVAAGADLLSVAPEEHPLEEIYLRLLQRDTLESQS